MIESPDLLAFLKEEEVRSRNEDLQMRAETNLRSYKGDYYGDEVDGRSKAVARDVAEVIDHMEVSVLRTFVSGDRVVEFEPMSVQDEQAADDATEVMRRDFSRKGYRLLHDWFKEGNINILGIAKACTETKKVKRTQLMPKGMQIEQGEVISTEPAGIDPVLGEMVAVTVMVPEIQFVDRLVPLEEFRFSPDACTLDDAAYLAHATLKTISDLVEMGFDADDLENVSYDYAQSETSLAQARSTLRYFDHGVDRQGALRQVVLMEEYPRFDFDGDGVAERLCVHRVGDTILMRDGKPAIEEVDYQPFRVYCPFPMPSRIDGEALAEKVADIQRINTALMRLALDGLYCNLAPGYLVPDSAVNDNTFDDLLTVRPNRIVRYSGPVPPTAEQKQDVSGVAFQAMEFMIGQRESRTGVTRLNQGLDADTLNKTATGQALLQAQGQQMEEYLARNFAEALAELMTLKYQLYRRYSPPIRLRVDGEYRMIDPSQWPSELDIIIRVGLGTGRKEQRLMNRMNMLSIQKEVLMAGLPIVQPEQIYKSISGVVRDAGLGSPADYVIDPATIPPQPPKPSAEQMKIQGEQQLAAAKLNGEQQIAAMKLQGEQQLAGIQMQLEMAKAQHAADLERTKLGAELAVARERANIENALAELKAQGIQLDHAKMDHAAKLAEAEMAHRAALDNDRAVFEANLAQNRADREAALAETKATIDAHLANRKADADAAIKAADLDHKATLELAATAHDAQLQRDKAALDANLAHGKAAFEAGLAQNKAEADATLKTADATQKAELERAKATEDAQLERDKATEDAKLERDRAEHEAQLAEDKAAFEASLAVREQQFQEDLAKRNADRADAVAVADANRGDHIATRNADRSDYEAQHKMSKNRPGGDLSE